MRRQGSASRTDPTADDIPLATAQAVGEGDTLYVESHMEEAEHVHLLSTTNDSASPTTQPSTNATTKATDKAPAFAVTTPTQDGQEQAYWGRFNDAQAEVLPTNNSNNDGAIPVATARLDDRLIRLAFIRKVYTILACQMLVTFAVCAAMTLWEPVRVFAVGPGAPMYIVSIVISFVCLCALHAYKRSYPTNFYLLSVFTLAMSYLVGVITAMYAEAGAGELVMEAIFITATVFIVLTVFTLQSKWDFSFMGAALGMCLWILLLWGIFGMIFGLQTGSVYALFGSILFSMYIIYDTYMIAERLDPEDYIVAAIELYLDLVNLFLYILRLLSELDRR